MHLFLSAGYKECILLKVANYKTRSITKHVAIFSCAFLGYCNIHI